VPGRSLAGVTAARRPPGGADEASGTSARQLLLAYVAIRTDLITHKSEC
jgi:hypothetical protein